MADPVSTSVVLSGIATFGGLLGSGGGRGFKATFQQAIDLARAQQIPPPPIEEPAPVVAPTFVQVQGDVTGFGDQPTQREKETLLQEILRRTGPRGVRFDPTRGIGTGTSGRGAPGGPARGTGSTPRRATKKEQAEQLERVTTGQPTPNVPAVIKRPVGPPAPRRKLPEGVKIGAKEKAALAVGIIGSAIIGGGGIIRVGPGRPGQPPPGEVGPFPPAPEPGDIGPFPPGAEEQRDELREIEVTARRKGLPQTSGGAAGPPISPPVGTGQPLPVPSPPRSVPRSVLLGILSAASFAGARFGTRQASTVPGTGLPAVIPSPQPPSPQPATAAFLRPPGTPSDTRTRQCDKAARKNRKTCWEGFYREFRNGTKFTRWTKVDCKTRKIIEER